MSDGPHRSLPMRPAWKKVVERAGNEAYSTEEICEAIGIAVRKDWQKEISPALIKSILGLLDGKTLFCMDPIQYLKNLRPITTSSVMGNALLDTLILIAYQGKFEQATFQKAIAGALNNQFQRSVLQIEEHCLRESSEKCARKICQRTREAIQSTDFESLTDQILFPDSKLTNCIKKNDQLKDGVSLC